MLAELREIAAQLRQLGRELLAAVAFLPLPGLYLEHVEPLGERRGRLADQPGAIVDERLEPGARRSLPLAQLGRERGPQLGELCCVLLGSIVFLVRLLGLLLERAETLGECSRRVAQRP